jgi:antitoxin component of RelBE/YafQ-DinJ toxin-antitoxin module
MSKTVRARLDEVSVEALAVLTSVGITESEAVRRALIEAAARARRRSQLAAEVAVLAIDPADQAARAAVMADMEALAPDVPE